MNGHHNEDISLLTIRRQEASELARLQRAAAELPILEAEEQERLRRESAQQQLERASFDLEPLAKRYRLALQKSNLEIVELLKFTADLIRRRQEIDRQGREVENLARAVASARIELGQTPTGTWGNSHNENMLMLQSVMEAVLKEHRAELGLIQIDDESEQTRLMLSLLTNFCDVRQAAKPPQVTSGKVLIKKYVDGQDVQYWG